MIFELTYNQAEIGLQCLAILLYSAPIKQSQTASIQRSLNNWLFYQHFYTVKLPNIVGRFRLDCTRNLMTHFIFVTGGVVSSLGKGTSPCWKGLIVPGSTLM
jgi:hypothetical protein